LETATIIIEASVVSGLMMASRQKVNMRDEKLSQEDLADELLVSQNKYMECSICQQEVSFNRDGDEEYMEEHFKEKHGYKGDD
jgi:hypothetical protein